MKGIFFGGIVCIVLFWAAPVFAVSVQLSNLPSSLDHEASAEIDVSLACGGCSDSYLRGVFYPSGTSYFGFTQSKQGEWVNGPASACMQYYHVASSDLVEGSWSGKLKIKPDATHAFYTGPGEYLFKVGRYTGSCSSPTWSAEATILILGPSPTSSSTPMPTVPTVTATVVPTLSFTPTRIVTPAKIISSTLVLAISSSAAQISPTDEQVLAAEMMYSEPVVLESSASSFPFRAFSIAFALVSMGCALLCITFAWQKRNALG
jgi:hypothetical protein